MRETQAAPDIDRALVDAARDRDPAALRSLVEATYPLVARWARTWTADPADADDLTQDVMVRIVRHLDRWQGRSRFTSWVYALTRNAALDRHRREARYDHVRTEHGARALMGSPTPSPADGASGGSAVGDRLEVAFRALPDRQREVFDLVELQGLTSVEAADLMGIEPVSVRAHLHKARRALRTRILNDAPHLAPHLG